MSHSPCILSISYDPDSDKGPFQLTGVDSLSSLQQNIQMRGVDYHLGAVIFANGNHFCSISVDPVPHGNLNVFYDGIKRGNCYTNFVPFVGSHKHVVGSCDISQLCYIRQKFEKVTEQSLVSKPILNSSDNPNEEELNEVANEMPISTSDDDWTWKTAALPEVWNDGEDLEFIYHGAVYEDTTLCELTPVILPHLNSNITYWNEMAVMSFVNILAYHMATKEPYDNNTYNLTPTSLPLLEIFRNDHGEEKGKKKQTRKQFEILALSDDLLEKSKQQRSIVFLLQ